VNQNNNFLQSRAATVKDGALQREAADLNNELVKLIDRRKHEPVGLNRMHEAERLVKTSREHIVTFVQVSLIFKLLNSDTKNPL